MTQTTQFSTEYRLDMSQLSPVLKEMEQQIEHADYRSGLIESQAIIMAATEDHGPVDSVSHFSQFSTVVRPQTNARDPIVAVGENQSSDKSLLHNRHTANVNVSNARQRIFGNQSEQEFSAHRENGSTPTASAPVITEELVQKVVEKIADAAVRKMKRNSDI